MESNADAIRWSIIEAWQMQFPRKGLKGMTEKERQEKNQDDMCEQLGGTIEGRSCTYTLYSVLGPKNVYKADTTIPLSYLTEDDLKGQYRPSREAVEAILSLTDKKVIDANDRKSLKEAEEIRTEAKS